MPCFADLATDLDVTFDLIIQRSLRPAQRRLGFGKIRQGINPGARRRRVEG
ncbi:hypothetical protein ABI_10110 [Asticcacaulis biprosthecium C19]|uniref:Uncharacterized protein n=1 Tax=Asticcacaulis biprosthecium C19 TaxID=715226 RepID=F4QH37_9CAUL|nr:hypothetical protein ABI_10110 [Asticcacaulis biprosthecium C19]